MVCPADFSIVSVRALHAELVEHLDSGMPLTIDGRAVERVDAAALQLLCSAARDAQRRNTTFTLHPSDALADAARVVGVAHLLGVLG